MRFRFALLFLAATAHAEWTIVSNVSEPGGSGIVHRRVVVEKATGDRITVDAAIFSTKSCTLGVLQNKAGSDTLAEAMRREGFLAGINGGYFDEKFAPIGLRIVNGQTIAPLQHARLITGVLVASSRDVQIVRAREFSRRSRVTAAIQCGPFLVDRGQAIGGLNASNLARRTFVATTTSNRALLGICSNVSLAGLSKMLSTTSFADDLKIQGALNLDGGSSSAFWFARENDTAFSITEWKPVRDFVGVVPK